MGAISRTIYFYKPLKAQIKPMNIRKIRFSYVAVALATLVTASAFSLSATAAGGSAPPDLSGLWVAPGAGLDPSSRATGSEGDDSLGEAPEPLFGTLPEYKGVYLESFKKRNEALSKLGVGFKSTCKLLGMPTMMSSLYAVEILQTPKQINWSQELYKETRRIYLDGRSHPDPEEVPPTFSGSSIGHWEGDVLVVETKHVRQETTLGEFAQAEDAMGHSPLMTIKERIFINGDGMLQVDTVVEDPKALAKPWKLDPIILMRAPKGTEFLEYICEDNNTETIDPTTGREVTNIPERSSPPSTNK